MQGEPLTETLTSQQRFNTEEECVAWLKKNKETIESDIKIIIADERIEHPDAKDFHGSVGCQQVDQQTKKEIKI